MEKTFWVAFFCICVLKTDSRYKSSVNFELTSKNWTLHFRLLRMISKPLGSLKIHDFLFELSTHSWASVPASSHAVSVFLSLCLHLSTHNIIMYQSFHLMICMGPFVILPNSLLKLTFSAQFYNLGSVRI